MGARASVIVEGREFESPQFRRAVWHQTATTVALVTTAFGDRRDVMACEWAMMVSASPLRFVISVAPRRATHELIEQAGVFGLSFCSDQQARLSHVSGSYSLHDVDKWALAEFPTYPARQIDVPMIAGSVLNVECRLIATQPLDDHTLFVGEAVWARADPKRDPLIYHDGKYWQIGAQLPKE
jgi:flavin reductase (DIM6/NTAB) family NADH-FMN oxidoreductase RutF